MATAVPVIQSMTNYKQTQRIVLLMDLNPSLHLQNPNPYLISLMSTAKTLLSFPQLSSSLFSFKPFFSSLSPLLSSSRLSIPSLSLSFNPPNTTLDSLSHFLTSLLTTTDKVSIPSSSPRALHLSASLRQLVHDYAWDSIISDDGGDHSLSGFHQSVMKSETKNCESKSDISHSFGLVGSQFTPSPSNKDVEIEDSKRKKTKKSLNMLQELTWSAFYKAALDHFDLDLEDVYFARGCSKSKKLKFLRCWIKQIKKSSNCSLTELEGSKLQQDIPKEVVNRLTKLPQECEQPIASCSSVAEDSLSGASRIQDEVVMGLCSESLESFLNNLPHKIQQGLESEEVDLASLANRLVNSSIFWLYQKYEKETMSESQIHVVKSDDPSSSIVALQLTNLLLVDPKDLATVHKNGHRSSHASSEATSENIIREYELQILFRMEILQSEVGASFVESTKQKFAKQICLLLENVQCHLQGDFFGDWSLDKYVEKIIKSRYGQSLGDVVEKIYERMDLLLFEDEEETANTLLNSEESSQSWREKHKRDEADENCIKNNQVSTEEEPFQGAENEHQSLQGEEHARKLLEAQQRRQRARRFASFTSWVPDLQRVWAPKQPKAMKVNSDHVRKFSKRKEKGRLSYDTVCETPMSGLKRSCGRGGGSSGEKDYQDTGSSLRGSVSKALFQDD
eukprot:XP_015571099.1 uncharacterized protein LOC8277055 isoform X2 [Ricinus communis]